jgi:hypothetical protein
MCSLSRRKCFTVRLCSSRADQQDRNCSKDKRFHLAEEGGISQKLGLSNCLRSAGQ